MHDWLLTELQAIKTPRFHQLDGPADDQLRHAILDSPLDLPEAYKQFVITFGNARLFRQSLLGYKMTVLAGPRKIETSPGWLHLASFDDQIILMHEGDPRVFGKSMKKPLADSFDHWLLTTYTTLKSRYPRQQWRDIEAGPPPFDTAEAAIADARQNFTWTDLGLAPDQDRLIRIENRSTLSLSRFTLGARSTDRQLNGALHLDVSHIAPGQNDVLKHNCYKHLRPPDTIQLHDLPPPGPEDRNYYAEFK